MKRLAILICAALSLAGFADTEIVTVSDGEVAPDLLRRYGQGAHESDPHEVTE